MGRPEKELRGKDLRTKSPQVDDALQKVLFMIRRPGSPAWPKRLRLRTLSEEELPKATAEVGKATVGLTEKTLPGLMRYGKIEKANLNGNHNDKPLVFPNGQTAPQLEGKQRQFLERVIIAATEGRIFSEEDLRKIYTDSRTSSYLWNLLSATRHWVELKIKPLGWTTEWHKPGENEDQKGYELKKIEDSSIVSPTIKPPSNEQATSAKSSYSLILPNHQIIPDLLKQEAEILGLVIKAPSQSLDLSDPHLEKSRPELFSKNSAGSFRVQLSRLRSKLSKLGWNIETVGFKTGWRNNHRGKIELRRIEKLDDNPEDQVTASAPTEHVEQEDQPTDDSPPPTQEPVAAPTLPTELPRGGTIVDFSPESPLKLQENNNNPLILPDGKKAPKLRGELRKFLRLLIAAKNGGRDFSEQDLKIMYPDIHSPLYAWKKLSRTACRVRPRIRDLGWNIEFKISKDGTKKTYELNQPVEPSGSNPIPIIFPDGTEGPKTWGRIRKILETLIEAYKEGRIFSKKEIWQKVCPEIPFKEANYKISKAIMDNLKSILLDTQWRIEAVKISQNEHVTYALMKKVEVSENPISDKEIPVSANGSKPIEDSTPAQEPAVTPTVAKEPPKEGTIVDFSANDKGVPSTQLSNPNIPANGNAKRRLPEKPYYGAHVLPEAEKYQIIAAMEIDLTRIAVSKLMTEDGLKSNNGSAIELIKKVIPKNVALTSLLGIKSKPELEEYFIESITKTADRIWGSRNVFTLSEKEQRISENLTSLRNTGYDIEKIIKILRVLFSIPAPVPVPAPAAARAN